MENNSTSGDPILDMFIFETYQLIEQLEEMIIRCEKSKDLEDEDINEIFRIMHTIKGSSAMMVFNNISIVAHSLEDLFYFIRENKNVVINFEKLSDMILSGIDFIKVETNKIENGNKPDGISDEIVASIEKYLNLMKESYKKDDSSKVPIAKKKKENIKKADNNVNNMGLPSKYAAKILFEEDCQMENVRAFAVVHNIESSASEVYYIPDDITENNESSDVIRKNGFLLCFTTPMPFKEIEKVLNQTTYLRSVKVNKVDDYPDEIKELLVPKEIITNIEIEEQEIINVEAVAEAEVLAGDKENISVNTVSKQQSIISVNVSKLDILMDLVGEIVISESMVTKNPEVEGLNLEGFKKASIQLRKLTNELQDIVMSIRMVPVSMTFHKMNRIVRDMSKKLNKAINLEIIGEDTEVDKNIIDHLSDPLMHIIRNSVDHGIESKEDRLKLGKNEAGKITLEARNAGSDVVIIIRDDGQGLERQRIIDKARENGLVTKPDNELTDKEVFSFILLPGFSTNEKVTEFSGRGVGMDVVKRNIENIGGSVSIESKLGEGTTILIKIPLTLAIIEGMEIAVGKVKYTVPITSIRECFKASKENIIEDPDGNEMIMIRGMSYPILRLHKALKVETEITSIDDGIMIMVDGDSNSACLFADRLIGEQQAVVKALPRYLKKIEGIAGCTILGDGSISLIIDVNGILEKL